MRRPSTPLGARRFAVPLFGIVVTCLVLRGIHLAVDLVCFHKLRMGAHGIHRAAVHDDDAVRVLYGGDALGNDDLCRFGYIPAQRLAD